MVNAIAAVVAADFPVDLDNSFQETACENSAGNNDGTFSAPYNVKFTLPIGTDVSALFAKARDYWDHHGYRVGNDNLATSDPRLHAWLGDYQLALHIPSGGQIAYLGGDTPCLPESKK